MKSTSPPMDSSAKFWLMILAVTVLSGVAVVIYSFTSGSAAVTRQTLPTRATGTAEPEPPVTPVVPDIQLPFDSPFATSFSQPTTPEARAEIHKEMVNRQADYFQELHSKYPKSASLATPEEIEEMRKSGRLAR